MLDFGISPPEVTSAKMYSGPGSGPLMAAASAWDALAAQLESFATGYQSTITTLQDDGWAGPAAAAMAAAATPYAEWATTTGAQIEHAAIQARAAGAAYETAHAAIVPPALVAANRTHLADLVATNLLGQNTPQIAATESDYAQMWARNTHTMYDYAASASSASKLSPFQQPPETTNPAGGAAQAGAVAGSAGASGASHTHTLAQAMSSVPQQLQNLSTAGTSAPSMPDGLSIDSVLKPIDHFGTIMKPTEIGWAAARTVGSVGSFGINLFKLLGTGAAAAPSVVMPTAATAGVAEAATAGAAEAGSAGASNAVLASVGDGAPVGQLSVPPAWADATPVAAATEDPLWLSDTELDAAPLLEAAPEANMAGAAPAAGLGPMAGMAGAAGVAAGRASVSNMLRVPPRRFKMPRHSAGG